MAKTRENSVNKLSAIIDPMWAVVPEGTGDLHGVMATFKDESDAEEFRMIYWKSHCVVKVTAELELIMEDD